MPITRRGLLGTVTSFAISRRALAADVDVMIVGAGAAGLAAAKHLQRSGHSIRVFEARSRIGGRAFTDTSLGEPFDAGAHYVHWAEGNPWKGIAADLGVRLDEERLGSPMRFFRKDKPISDGERAASRQAYREVDLLVEATGQIDQSFADAVRGRPEEFSAAAGGITLLALGEEPERVSLQDYRQLWSGDDLIPAGGYGALVAQYGADVPVKHATPVTGLDWSGAGVIAGTAAGTVTARTAIVTVPIGVLKGGSLRFTPDLPADIQRALDGLHMGALTKIALRVDPIALAAAGSTDLFDSDPHGAQLSFELWPEKGLALVHVGGDHARRLCEAGDRTALDYATERLAGMLGDNIRKAITSGHLADWWTDPFSLGSYSIVEPGHIAARDALKSSIGDRIWLAGEASAGGAAMTVGGATLEGERAARAVSEHLRNR